MFVCFNRSPWETNWDCSCFKIGFASNGTLICIKMRVVQNLENYCDLWTTPKKQRITDALGLTIILQKYHHEKTFWRNVGRVAYWLITFKILPLLSHAFWLLFPRVRFIDCSRSFATKKGACIRPLVSQILLKVQPFLT